VVADRRTLELSLIGKETVSGAARTAGRALDDMGDEAKGAIRDFEKLDRQIAQTEVVIAGLAAEIAATGDIDLFKDLNRNKSLLRSLQGVKRSFGDAGQDSGRSFSTRLAKAITDTSHIALFSPAGLAIGGTIAAAASPVLVPALAAAITAGVSGAAVGAGLLIASRDPKVKSAAHHLADVIGAGLQRAAMPFVDGAVRALGIFEVRWGRIDPIIERTFAKAATFVEPLAMGLAGAAEGLAVGVEKAVGRSGPIIDTFSRHLAELGLVLGDAFDRFSRSSDDTAKALGAVLGMVEQTVVATAFLVEQFSRISPLLAGATGGLWIEWLDHTAKKTPEASEVLKKLREALAGVSGGLATVDTNASNAKSALQNFQDALKAQTDPVFAFKDALNTVAEKQRAYNKALKEHGPKSEAARQAALDLAGASINLQGASAKMAETFGNKVDPALHDALVAAGLTGKKLHDVESAFYDVRTAGQAAAKKYEAKVYANTVQATKALHTVRNSLDSLDRYIPITVAVSYRFFGKPGSGGGLQHGGHAPAGAVRWVGEAGPELVRFRTPATVYSASRSRAMAASMARSTGGGGGTTITVAAGRVGRNPVVDLFLNLLRSGDLQLIVGDDGSVRAR
jgi:hypothetical protein